MRITMSIPLYFEAVNIDSLGRVLDKKHNLTNCDLAVDGGLTGNFPITLFDSVTWTDKAWNRRSVDTRIEN